MVDFRFWFYNVVKTTCKRKKDEEAFFPVKFK